MPPDAPDALLVHAYATERSETAFRALVDRHIHLVFATALRQIGDAGIAEEVTQNVFITLARKAPRLAGIETLAGWLHRTALLEAKARLRSELRRTRREEVAAQIAAVQNEGNSPLEPLIPFLDEALLHLREVDRLALLLRFFENQALRDVGRILGVDEDAARKRVSRALDRVSEFFRKRGFAVPAGTGAAALMTQAAQAAPAVLASQVAQAGLIAAGGTSSINLLLLHLMSLSKTQTAGVAILLAAVPLALQWNSLAEARTAHAEAFSRFGTARHEASELQSQIERTSEALKRAEAERVLAAQRATASNIRPVVAPAPRYAWNDEAALVRIPKAVFGRIGIGSMKDTHGALTDEIKEALQMTEVEAEEVEGTLRRALAEFRTLEGTLVKPVPARPDDLKGQAPEDVRVFAVPDLRSEYLQLRDKLMADLGQILGEERLEYFRRGLTSRLVMEDDFHGISSGHALFFDAKRVRIYRPGSLNKHLMWSVELSWEGRPRSSIIANLVEPAPPYRQFIEDWLDMKDALLKPQSSVEP
jgi:RNA polymerase sigma factor (sigma-70 family)